MENDEKLLRIAAMAMQAILSSQSFPQGIKWEEANGVANEAILCAKELMRAVNKDKRENYGDED